MEGLAKDLAEECRDRRPNGSSILTRKISVVAEAARISTTKPTDCLEREQGKKTDWLS